MNSADQDTTGSQYEYAMPSKTSCPRSQLSQAFPSFHIWCRVFSTLVLFNHSRPYGLHWLPSYCCHLANIMQSVGPSIVVISRQASGTHPVMPMSGGVPLTESNCGNKQRTVQAHLISLPLLLPRGTAAYTVEGGSLSHPLSYLHPQHPDRNNNKLDHAADRSTSSCTTLSTVVSSAQIAKGRNKLGSRFNTLASNI